MGERPDPSHDPVVGGGLHDPEPVPEVRPTPAECIDMMWELTVNAWASIGVKVEGRMRRDVVRVYRDGELVYASHPELPSEEIDAVTAAVGAAQPPPSD